MKLDDATLTLIREMWSVGNSSGDIAEKLGWGRKVGRNRVCGLVHRMGIMKSDERKAKVAKPESMPHPKGGGVQLDALGQHDCHWPIGHPGDKRFRFCGQPTEGLKPYCSHHCGKAYRRIGDNNAAEFVER
jgi:GcrA cell cycle regulator